MIVNCWSVMGVKAFPIEYREGVPQRHRPGDLQLIVVVEIVARRVAVEFHHELRVPQIRGPTVEDARPRNRARTDAAAMIQFGEEQIADGPTPAQRASAKPWK